MKLWQLFLAFGLFFCVYSVSVIADTDSTCTLKPQETLTIGCTYECGFFNEWAISSQAKELNYKVKTIDLTQNKTLLTQLDGVIIPGGADIHPNWYNTHLEDPYRSQLKNLASFYKKTPEGPRRDQFEFDFLKQYFQHPQSTTLPLLGICRGMQALTVSQGIPLYIDIKKQLRIPNRMYTLDKVSITDDSSLIKQLFSQEKFWAVELHHQALNLDYFNQYKNRWPHLKLSAFSNDHKIVEALEFKNRPILGVQFHPEYTFGHTRTQTFSWLLTKACEHKNQKQKTILLSKGDQ